MGATVAQTGMTPVVIAHFTGVSACITLAWR
jgi:hypothetical protein